MLKRGFLIVWTLLFIINVNSQDITFTKTVDDTATSYNFVNKTYAPVTLKIAKLKEIEFFIKEGETICKPEDSLIKVISIPKRLVENDSTFKTEDFINVSYSFGIRLFKDSIKSHLYELPFQRKKRYKIMQGFNGKFSHSSEQSRYAIDFKMPIGDTIVAARSGYVVHAISHFTERGGREFRNKANQIIVFHDDGTLAFYVHLDTNGVLVKVNDYVKAGQPIGISGFTGFTTKPHLHFVVRNFDSAIPIEFKKQKNLGSKSGIWIKN